jgi:ubiquinone/menaquinone biosynthesis C-methylase UbiE
MNPVQTFYTQKAKLYKFFFVDLLKWNTVLETFFQENAYLRPGMKILDAGCGTGTVTKVLVELARRKGFEDISFHGFDLTPAMLDLFHQWINKEAVQNIHLQQANVLDLENQLPQDWVDFDLIVASALLEYIPKDKLSQALGNLKGLLHHQGRLLVIATKRTRLTSWTAARWWRTNLFDQEELEKELRQAGFTTIEMKKLPESWDAYMIAVEAKF